MGNSRDVEESLPGLRFRGVQSKLTGTSTPGKLTGVIELKCEVIDIALWDMAVQKFESFKMFGSVNEEILEAFRTELDSTVGKLTEHQEEIEELQRQLAEKDEEISRLQGILASVGVELGL